MGLLDDLFTSRPERERRDATRRRAALRAAERAIRKLFDDIAQLKRDRDRSNAEAKGCIKIGDETRARTHLHARRRIELEIVRRERRAWLVEQQVRRARLGQTDRTAVDALVALHAQLGVTPEKVEDVFDGLADEAGLQEDAERAWEAAHDRELADVGLSEKDLPSVDDMLASLQREVATEIGTESDEAAQEAASLTADINASRENLKSLMEARK